MKKKISLEFIIIASLGILSTLFFSMWISYDMIKEQVIKEIRIDAWMLEKLGKNVEWSRFDELQNELRITVVDLSGVVIYDNMVSATALGNHGERVEIQKAIESGEGFAIRSSDTLSENLFYYAIKSEHGFVIRVAMQADNAWGIFLRMIPVIVVIVLILLTLCVCLSRFITIKLVKPIENVANHIDDIESVEVYEELVPFVSMIQKQHEDIMRNATMRQEFTANVSHELKTPLTSISGYAELMENNLVDSEHIVQFSQAIHKNADRLLTLINDIIRLSELDAVQTQPEFENIDLYILAANCAQMLQVNALTHEITLNVSGESKIIWGNRQMLEELIYNLCDNAIRYNKECGSVEIRIYDKNEGICLEVKDSGIGIPKEHQERIFERFYRVDKSRSKATGGTGLGLAIVKHIAVVHRAALEVISEPNVGTQILVTFPFKND